MQLVAIKFLRILCPLILLVLFLLQTSALAASDRVHVLRAPIHRLTILPGGETALIISNSTKRIQRVELKTFAVLDTYHFKPLFESATFHDVSYRETANDAFFIGTNPRRSEKSAQKGVGDGILLQLRLTEFEARVVHFFDSFLRPSVSINDRGNIVIGDLGARAVSVVSERELFGDWSSLSRAERRSNLPNNIFLRGGAALDVAISASGEYLFVAHADKSVISLIDVWRAEIFDQIGWSGAIGHRRITPLIMSVFSTDDHNAKSGAGAIILLGDAEEDLLVALDTNLGVSALRTTGTAPLGLSRGFKPRRLDNPLLLSASQNMQTIVVASRASKRVVVFSREGKFLERQRILELGEYPSEIDVSPKGNILAVVSRDRRRVRVIENIGTVTHIEISNRLGRDAVRTVQRILSRLGYRIGVVDGIEGPGTQFAIASFQSDHGLVATGKLDKKTMQKIIEREKSLRDAQ